MHQDRRLRSAPRGVGDGDEDTSAPAAVAISSPGFEIFPPREESLQADTLRAVSGSRSIGIPRVFGIRPDRFDDQVELVGAVDFSRNAVERIVCDELGFSEVVQPIDPAGGMVLHDEDDTGAVFRP